MRTNIRRGVVAFTLVVSAVFLTPSAGAIREPGAAQEGRQAVKSLRLYIFDLGNIPVNDPKGLFSEPLKVSPGGCCTIVGHLIVHPKGTLLWDTGVVPDAQIGSGKSGMAVPGKRSLKQQLAEIGYSPKDITYLAFSHFHFDHTANANDYQSSTWIVQEPERDAMLAKLAGKQVPGTSQPEPGHYSALQKSKTIILANIDDYDVFGDGTVVIKPAPGHTPGQQVLVLKLPKTGTVMLAGDPKSIHAEVGFELVLEAL